MEIVARFLHFGLGRSILSKVMIYNIMFRLTELAFFTCVNFGMVSPYRFH